MRGFTLIELITAIGVLAILATAVISVINPIEQFKKSQDAKRKSDLAQVQRALEVYYQDYNKYPDAVGGKISTDGIAAVDWGDDWRPYMDVLPIDPKGAKNYAYYSTGQSYALFASLDRGSRDPQVCNNGAACTNSAGLSCGGVCDYGVSSPNIAP